jgi:P-type E1-E2 ATPase
VTLLVEIPGGRRLELDHLVLDVNGTLSDRGALLDGVPERVDRLREVVELHLVSGDTFGTLDALAAELDLPASQVATGEDKLEVVERLGRERCAVVGNGTNDALVLEAAALGIAVVGPEGASGAAVRSADVLGRTVLEALDLLLDPRALRATLRP